MSLLNPFSKRVPEPQDDRPLPEIIADGGEDWDAFPLAFVDDQERYYAVQDWIRGVAQTIDSKAAAELWRAIKRRLQKAKIETRTWCTPLPYRAADGKVYQRDHATAEGLYLITQRMSAETGIRNKVLHYLARAGVKLDEMRIEPSKALAAGVEGYKRKGKDDKWIEARLDGKIKRSAFTEALHNALSSPEPQIYGKATNAVYKGLFDRTARQLRQELGISESASLRDHLSSLALTYNAIAESIIAHDLGDNHDLTWAQAERIIKSVAAIIRPQIEAVSRHLGVDLPTGKKILDGHTS